MKLCAAIATIGVLTISVGVGAVSAAPPPPPPVGGVRIESVSHNVRGPLKAGDTITVTMRGSAGAVGGTAAFHIFGVATAVPMQEVRQTQPALYTGSYQVQAGDTARSAVILVTLRLGNREVAAIPKPPITIATTGPVITAVYPAPEAQLANSRPNLVVRFFDATAGGTPAVKMLVNGADVSSRAVVAEGSASYSPDAPLPPGPVRVRVELANTVQSATPTEWTFTVVPAAELIKSVTINPTTALKAGDILTVVMTGTPGGEATLTIEGSQESALMRESKTPGVYLGNYMARPQLRLVDAPVTVTLSKAGQRSTMAASLGVTILSGAPAAPTVRATIEPSADRRGPRLLLTGRAVPRARVDVELTTPAFEKILAADDQGPLGQFSTVATTDGSWRIVIAPILPLPGTKVQVGVVTSDGSGQRSPRSTAEVTFP